MKYFLNLLLLVFLVFSVNYASAANRPASIEIPEDVVSSLYRDFGWEIKENPSSKEILNDQTISVLKRYFTPKLAKLIAKDRRYEVRTKEVGHIDFVLVCGSQDPDGISNIRIDRKPGTNIVVVLYDQNDEKDVMKIEFYTVHTQSGWRISNVHYKTRKTKGFPDPGLDFSLLDLLSQPY